MTANKIGRIGEQLSLLVQFGPAYDSLVDRLPPVISADEKKRLNKAKALLWSVLEPRQGYVVSQTIMSESLVKQRDSRGKWETVIEIRCGDEKYYEYVTRRLKQKDARELLENCPFIPPPPIVVFDSTLKQKSLRPQSGVDVDDLHSETSASVSYVGTITSAVNGDEVLLSTGAKRVAVLIGGVILVGDSVFGLTVGHALPVGMKDLEIPETRYTRGDDSASPPPVDTPQYEYDISAQADDEHQLQEADAISLADDIQPASRSRRLLSGQLRKSRFRSGLAEDWALIKLSTPFLPVNELRFPGQGQKELSIPIDNILQEGEFSMMLEAIGKKDGGRLRCIISTPEGVVPALVEPGTQTLLMNGASFEVLRIVAGTLIKNGTSGCWVTVDGRLLGTVIAGQDATGLKDVGYAYVLPIEKTFESISALMKDEIRLPNKVDNDIMILQQRKEQSKWLIPSTSFDGSSSETSISNHASGDDLAYELLIAERQVLRRSHRATSLAPGQYEDEGPEPPLIPTELYSAVPVWHRKGAKAKLYEELTKLRYETIERIMVLGQAFPLSPFFRAPMISWVHRNKISRIHGRRGFAALMLLEDCSTTEAGENFLGLFFALRRFSMQRGEVLDLEGLRARDDDWLVMVISALFQAMNIPPLSRPSAPQLRLFVDLCMAGFSDFKMDGLIEGEVRLSQNRSALSSKYGSAVFDKGSHNDAAQAFNSDDLMDAGQMAKLLLSISEMARVCSQDFGISQVAGILIKDRTRSMRADKALICSGSPWADWAGSFAESALGLTVEWRYYFDGQYTREAKRQAADQAGPPMVYAFVGTDSVVCELVSRKELPPPPIVSKRTATMLPRPHKSRFRKYINYTRRKPKRDGKEIDWISSV